MSLRISQRHPKAARRSQSRRRSGRQALAMSVSKRRRRSRVSRSIRKSSIPKPITPMTLHREKRPTATCNLLLRRVLTSRIIQMPVRLARSVLRDYPRFDDVRILLARALLGANQTADAGREFQAVLDEKLPTARSLAWANVGLADIASKSGQKPRLRSTLRRRSERMLNMEPRWRPGTSERGSILRRRRMRASRLTSRNLTKRPPANRKADLERWSFPAT